MKSASQKAFPIMEKSKGTNTKKEHYGYRRQWMEINMMGVSEGKKKMNNQKINLKSNKQRRKCSWCEKQLNLPD